MKNILSFITLSFCQIIAFGQTDAAIRHIFYDLPLDKSSNEIKTSMQVDHRFKVKASDYSFLPTCFALASDNGVVQSTPDSVEIELTWGGGHPNKKNSGPKLVSKTYVRLRYFYPSIDSVEKEYQRVLSLLRPVLKDTSYTGVDTVYSDHPYEREFKATGMSFRNNKARYKIEVLVAHVRNNYYGLYIELERDEK